MEMLVTLSQFFLSRRYDKLLNQNLPLTSCFINKLANTTARINLRY